MMNLLSTMAGYLCVFRTPIAYVILEGGYHVGRAECARCAPPDSGPPSGGRQDQSMSQVMTNCRHLSIASGCGSGDVWVYARPAAR